MPVDKTWGILNPSGIHLSYNIWRLSSLFLSLSLSLFLMTSLFVWNSLVLLTSIFFFTVRRGPQIDLEEFNFLKRIFSKSKPEEWTWAKLVSLNTVHWYCDGPKPTPAAIKYKKRTQQHKSVVPFCLHSLCLSPIYPSSFLEMDNAKRRAMIRL